MILSMQGKTARCVQVHGEDAKGFRTRAVFGASGNQPLRSCAILGPKHPLGSVCHDRGRGREPRKAARGIRHPQSGSVAESVASALRHKFGSARGLRPRHRDRGLCRRVHRARHDCHYSNHPRTASSDCALQCESDTSTVGWPGMLLIPPFHIVRMVHSALPIVFFRVKTPPVLAPQR